MAELMRKQIQIYLPLADWTLVRDEAARLGLPMTELARRWIEPELARLRRQPPRPCEDLTEGPGDD